MRPTLAAQMRIGNRESGIGNRESGIGSRESGVGTGWHRGSLAATTPQSTKPSSSELGFRKGSLAVSYFHTGIRTIIGAEAFHGPVRNGKAWDHLAMATRHKLSTNCRSLYQAVFPAWPVEFCISQHPFDHFALQSTSNDRVKPHEQLVSVSFTPHSASTPDLSTSWSRTTLQGPQGSREVSSSGKFPA